MNVFFIDFEKHHFSFPGNLTKEEFTGMKQELEAEYLATFKKTVAMHETFLTRLATHPVFRLVALSPID